LTHNSIQLLKNTKPQSFRAINFEKMKKQLANTLLKASSAKTSFKNQTLSALILGQQVRFYNFGSSNPQKLDFSVGGNISSHGSIPGLQISSTESYSERLRTTLLSVSG